MKRRHILQMFCMLAIMSIVAVFSGVFAHVTTAHAATSSTAKSSGAWSTYLYDSGHSGFNKNETIITPTSAKTLKQKWVQSAGGLISVQPVEADNMVFWGGWNDGLERATSLTGKQVWATSVGVSPPANCGPSTL